MTQEFELLKLMPAGLIPAAALLWVFLRVLSQREAAIKEITANFATKVEQIDKQHRDQVDTLVERFRLMQGEWAKQQKQVIDDYIAITRDTVVAVKELQFTVRELKDAVSGWERRIHDGPERRKQD